MVVLEMIWGAIKALLGVPAGLFVILYMFLLELIAGG